ncbi:PadR family transcriptional regulator [Mycobacterium interjectum]|uniref:PadR family transcriptional regulator n=1 Tax=Mycobacterium interjectum TaxID=33895 RepID=UPI0021F36A50|nr:PadR family transcriptional regulator [Mycobacterium interjectum]MCV7092708.1 helix-turn-helix transcriptional regulator [Mycobacterium interjectum]
MARPNDPGVLILTSLASGPKHGYALARDIEAFSGAALGPGTLYGAITRLEERGLIEPLRRDERRRPYRLTAAGRAELAAAVRELGVIVDEGARRLGLPLGTRRRAGRCERRRCAGGRCAGIRGPGAAATATSWWPCWRTCSATSRRPVAAGYR